MKSFRKFIEDYSNNPLQTTNVTEYTDDINKIIHAITVAIESEFDATRVYDNIMTLVKGFATTNAIANMVGLVIRDIHNEENKHIGQLLELLSKLSPELAEFYEKGRQEGNSQIEQAKSM